MSADPLVTQLPVSVYCHGALRVLSNTNYPLSGLFRIATAGINWNIFPYINQTLCKTSPPLVTLHYPLPPTLSFILLISPLLSVCRLFLRNPVSSSAALFLPHSVSCASVTSSVVGLLFLFSLWLWLFSSLVYNVFSNAVNIRSGSACIYR